MLSRRDALRGGTAVATCAAVTTAAGAVAAAIHDEPVLALERQWKAILEESHQLSALYRQLHDQLPAWAKSGPDGLGSKRGWPDVSALPEFKGLATSTSLGKRPDLGQVRRYNRMVESLAKRDPEQHAKVKAEGRARGRAWIARYREQKALGRQFGIDNWDDRTAPLYDHLFAIEDEIADTPAQTVAGLAAKLRIYAHYDPDGERVALSALADLERLVGEASS